MPDVVIRELADFPEWLPAISAWYHGEWRELLAAETPTDIEGKIVDWLSRDAIPTALVAVVDTEVVGTVALKRKEFEQFGEVLWLAGLYVVPQHRKSGIGVQLLRAAEKKAVALGIQKLYLYTPRAQRFYQSLGWQAREELVLPSMTVTVMEKVLFPHNLFQPLPSPHRG